MSYSFEITRTFSAPRELVYAAWTTPEHFAVWFGTSAIDVPLDTLSMDVRVGGVWTAVMNLPDGNQMNWTGEYVEVDPPAQVAFTITDQPQDPARALVTVILEPVVNDSGDAATAMTMTQSGDEMAEEQQAATVVGYNAFFDDIERIVAKLV